ncbi:MAG TPA: NADH-quinone oxidoreductase subunit N [Anaerolineaceae bacterium]|nr:NADH-quinone oxidoreductase subunit N [Anaerolineaceae bacterium]HPN50675.1 NADH-quinone oxidoreductase subunit N [Anaerolineaceae bacterium]
MTLDFTPILPFMIVAGAALALLVLDLFWPVRLKWLTPLLAAASLLAALVVELGQANYLRAGLSNMVIIDNFSVFANAIFICSGIAAIALAYDYIQRTGINHGEYYVLMLFSISGMLLMSTAADLIIVFLALELLSVPLYVLTGFARPRLDSEEAALKYFLLGAFSSGVLLYGIALLYGATSYTSLHGILSAVSRGTADMPLVVVGAAFLLVGVAFKGGVVPFHMWAPDVYQGAPTSVTGFMSVGAKAAGFVALLRIFVVAFPPVAVELTSVMNFLASLTMLIGNIAAIGQRNIKRMLAYSGIAQAGYMLMAFVPFGNKAIINDSVASMIFYLAVYAIASFGAWAVVVAVEQAEGRGLDIDDYAGLGRRYPLLGVAMLIFMLSFIGLPPTLGFWGKFYLFRSVIEGNYIVLALVGMLASLISAYYYLRVVVMMFLHDGANITVRRNWLLSGLVGVSALAVLLLGLMPGPLFQMAADALLRL